MEAISAHAASPIRSAASMTSGVMFEADLYDFASSLDPDDTMIASLKHQIATVTEELIL